MADFDASTAVPAPGQFDAATAVPLPPPQPRGNTAEVGTGLLRGAMVGLPTLAGKALQYVASPQSPAARFGRGMVESAEARSQQPYLQAQPESHGPITNAMAAGAEMIPSAVAVPLALGAGAAALGASPVLAGAAAVGGAGALFGAQAGQETLDKAAKAGVDPETAQQAARLNAASTFATQAAMGAIGGRALGVFGSALNKIVGKEGSEMAGNVLSELTGRAGTLMPVLKSLPATAAEATAVNAGQSAISAGIEQNAGIDNQSPVDAAMASIGPSLGLTALMTPLMLVARGAQVRSAQARTAALAHPETDPVLRAQLADQYGTALANADPASAAAFRANAAVAIRHKLALDVDSTMLDPGRVQPPPPEPSPFVQPNAPLALGRDPTAGQMVIHPDGTVGYRSEIENWINSLPPDQQIIERARLQNLGQQDIPAPPPAAPLALENNPSQGKLYTFPDGTTTTDPAVVEQYVNSLPENQQVAARAKLLGLGEQPAKATDAFPQDVLDLHEQVKQQLQAAGAEPTAMLTRQQFAKANGGLKGQELAKAYRAYTENPDTLRDLMRQDADKLDQLQTKQAQDAADAEAAANKPRNPLPGEEAPVQEPLPPSTAMADAMRTAMRKADEAKAAADAEAQKAREIDAIANVTKGAQLADAAERGEVQPDPNAPKGRDEITSDWKEAMAANEMDTKAQALAPFQKRVAALGLADMKTHQEQIDAVKAAMDDKKMSQTMRDRLSMLVNKWETDLGKKPEEPAAEAPAEEAPAAPASAEEPAAAPAAAAPAEAPAAPPAPAPAPVAVAPTAPGSGFKVGQTWTNKDGTGRYTVTSISPDGKLAQADFGRGQNVAVHFDAETANGWHPVGEAAPAPAAAAPAAAAAPEGVAVATPPSTPAAAAPAPSPAAPAPLPIRTKAEAVGTPNTKLKGPAPAHADQMGTNITSARFTPEQQKLIDGLKTGSGGRLGALARLREKVGDAMTDLLEKSDTIPDYAERMEALVKQADDIEAVSTEALARDREDRAQQQDTKNQQPAHLDQIGRNLDYVNVSGIADDAADRAAAIRAAFTMKMRMGEPLSDPEAARFKSVTEVAKALDRYTEGKASPSDEGFVRQLAAFIDEASEPWTKLPDYMDPDDKDVTRERLARIPGPNMDSPDQIDRGLLAPAALSHKLTDVLGHLAEHGSQPWVRELAAKLQPLLPDTSLFAGGPGEKLTVRSVTGKDYEGTSVATYETAKDEVTIHDGGASESTILHEATHAATVHAINDTMANWTKPARNQQDAMRRKALTDLTQTMEAAKKLPNADRQYGMTNEKEFIAELYANPDFRNFLRQNTLWGRAVNAVRRLLGMSEKEGPLLERALNASEPFFTQRSILANEARPDTMPHAFDGALNRMILKADDYRESLGTMASAAFKAVLPWRTVDNIAHGVRGIPELVRAGFADGVTAHERANMAHTVASEHLRTPLAQYVSGLQRELVKLGDKRFDVQREMMYIGGEASIGGFDFRKNGRDNLAANKGLDAKDKGAMDEVHRRYTQLQRQYPELAKHLDQGERLNRGNLIERVATVAANLMDARAGVARRLQADLARMSPKDAEYARMAESARLANLESFLASAHSNGLDFMDPSLSTAKNADPAKFQTGAHSELARRIDAAFKAAGALPDGVPMKAQMAALERIYRTQVDRPYFQLGRDGDYFVKVAFKGVDSRVNAKIQDALKNTNKVVGDLSKGGDNSAFFRVGTAAEAKALHDRLVLAGEGKVQDTAWGQLSAKTMDASGVAPAMRGLLNTLDEAVANTPGLHADQAQALKDTITREVLSLLPETSVRSAQMARRGVPGYDGDFMRSFARRASGSVHDTAGLYTSRSYMAAADQRAKAIDQLNRTGTAEGRIQAQQVHDEINKRYGDMMKPVGNNVVSLATSLSHSFYLGMSPAFFIRALAQPWHRGLPILGAKFGYADGFSEIGKATPIAMKVVANSVAAAVKKDGWRGVIGTPVELKDLGLTPGEQKFIEELHARGILDLGESSQLARMAEGDSAKVNDALRLASMTAGLSEMSNRLVMGLAAYRLAAKRPGLLGKETPTDFAVRAINLAMDNFDPNNTARAIGRHGFAGAATPLFTQFSNYSFQTMQQIFRTAHDGFFGQDKSPEGLQRAKEAKREFAGLMATTAVISGALGLPFATAFAGIYNALTSDPDDPKDVRVSIRNWANEAMGPTLGKVLTGGVGTLVGLDTSTFGLQEILPGSNFLADRSLWKDRADAQARGMLGPAISLGLDLGQAVSLMSDGYWTKGIEKALPVGLRSYYKTAEMAGLIGPGGYTDSRGNPLPMKAGASDLAWRALGFQTAEHAEQSDAQRDFSKNQELLKHRREVITDNFYKGVTTQPENMPNALAMLQRFNAINPMQAISGQELANTVRGHAISNALGMASGTGIPVAKRKFPLLQQQERFAAMPEQ